MMVNREILRRGEFRVLEFIPISRGVLKNFAGLRTILLVME
jgi:hypothetical protein